MGVSRGHDYKELGSMEPYALAIVAGAIPEGIDIQMYDDRFDEIDYDEKTDLVAITAETFTAKRAYAISLRFRERGVPVVIGGFHPSLIPNEAMQYADSIVVGEAEPVFKDIVEDLRNKRLRPFYSPGYGCNLAGCRPNRNIFKDRRYLPITLTHFSRGCPYACSYCPDAVLYEGRIRFRPVRDVVADIESQERDLIFFVDNSITYDKEQLKALLKAITPLKIKWISQADITVARDTDLLELMAKSGCLGLVVGFETLSEANLRQMRKVPNIPILSEYDALIRRIHDHGISMWAAFLLGYDYDTKDTIRETLEFAMKHKFFFAAFNQLIPYYGTPIYDFLQREKRLIFDKWWLDDDYAFNKTAFVPKNMSADELSEECLRARLTYNSYTNILWRATNIRVDIKSAQKLSLFFKYARIFKKEVTNKQGVTLD